MERKLQSCFCHNFRSRSFLFGVMQIREKKKKKRRIEKRTEKQKEKNKSTNMKPCRLTLKLKHAERFSYPPRINYSFFIRAIYNVRKIIMRNKPTNKIFNKFQNKIFPSVLFDLFPLPYDEIRFVFCNISFSRFSFLIIF